MNVAQLRALLEDWPDATPIAIRYLDPGEAQYTVDLTGADQYEEHGGAVSLLLVGNVDEAAS